MSYEYYFDAFRKYAEFKGRARRSEYWFFVLFHFIALMILTSIPIALEAPYLSFLVIIYFLGAGIPWLAVISRRLHDTGNSGAMFFIRFIPVVGGIWLFILYVTDSQHGPNKYGQNPKDLGNDDKEDDLINSIGSQY